MTPNGDMHLESESESESKSFIDIIIHTHSKYMAYVNSSEMYTIYLIVVVHA